MVKFMAGGFLCYIIVILIFGVLIPEIERDEKHKDAFPHPALNNLCDAYHQWIISNHDCVAGVNTLCNN